MLTLNATKVTIFKCSWTYWACLCQY